jgi:hypothetical protein
MENLEYDLGIKEDSLFPFVSKAPMLGELYVVSVEKVLHLP